ncbi:MAG: hypothetical protein DYG98_22480 [Haliscomenobacteraceae bacterium CHB4]|nr:hypothetical protein [Saprospiraceae bacterium]MCE7925827.1 hypothetical protein [Haliscomenobacteraceae bacterium CHB4]
MVVVKVVYEDIADKIDTQYIRAQFSNLPNIGIVFVCTPEGGEEDDWTDEDGLRHIVIHLPYDEVQKMPDARPMMLKKAKERLGLVS